MKFNYSIEGYAKAIDRSVPFVRNAVRLGLVEAKKVAGVWQITPEEVDRFKTNPFKIRRRDLTL